MADKNIWDPNPPPEQEIQPDNDNNNAPNVRIVGINLLVLAGYTFICVLLVVLLIGFSTCVGILWKAL